jgi:hypothetical protein
MLSDAAISLNHRYISLSSWYADLKYIKPDVSEWHSIIIFLNDEVTWQYFKIYIFVDVFFVLNF